MPKTALTQLASILDTWMEAGYWLSDQIQLLKEQFPSLYGCIDFDQICQCNTPSFLALVTEHKTGFDGQAQGGRGDMYRYAQQDAAVRSVGIQQIFALASPDSDASNLSAYYKILDVLGGDGTLARAISRLLPPDTIPTILTSDLSGDMVASAQTYGLPALQQPAQQLLLKDQSFDAVIIAYGSHHIPLDQRDQACREAFRILNPGGRLVLHDFEQGSPVANWFNEVVDRYSLTGHKFAHFTSQEIRKYLIDAGFTKFEVRYIYDPFILSGGSPEEVQRSLGGHLLNMYGLTKLASGVHGTDVAMHTYSLACQYFRYEYPQMGLSPDFGIAEVKTSLVDGTWQVEMPRVSLVGIGTK